MKALLFALAWTPRPVVRTEVVLCPTEAVRTFAVEEAADWWSYHGVTVTVRTTGCVPVTVDPEMPNLGMAYLMWFRRPHIVLRYGYDGHTLAHEIGHVAGYWHTWPRVPGTVMSTRVEPGWACTGMRHRGHR